MERPVAGAILGNWCPLYPAFVDVPVQIIGGTDRVVAFVDFNSRLRHGHSCRWALLVEQTELLSLFGRSRDEYLVMFGDDRVTVRVDPVSIAPLHSHDGHAVTLADFGIAQSGADDVLVRRGFDDDVGLVDLDEVGRSLDLVRHSSSHVVFGVDDVLNTNLLQNFTVFDRRRLGPYFFRPDFGEVRGDEDAGQHIGPDGDNAHVEILNMQLFECLADTGVDSDDFGEQSVVLLDSTLVGFDPENFDATRDKFLGKRSTKAAEPKHCDVADALSISKCLLNQGVAFLSEIHRGWGDVSGQVLCLALVGRVDRQS